MKTNPNVVEIFQTMVNGGEQQFGQDVFDGLFEPVTSALERVANVVTGQELVQLVPRFLAEYSLRVFLVHCKFFNLSQINNCFIFIIITLD
jgi:hypothetical protein